MPLKSAGLEAHGEGLGLSRGEPFRGICHRGELVEQRRFRLTQAPGEPDDEKNREPPY